MPLWDLRSFVAVGPIRFGMRPAEVRASVGETWREFRKGGQQVDQFPELLVNVHYSGETGGCEFVEFGGGDARPMLHGLDLMALSLAELHLLLAKLDPDLIEVEAGPRSPTLGVSVFSGGAPDAAGRPADGVAAFEKGYYERYGL